MTPAGRARWRSRAWLTAGAFFLILALGLAIRAVILFHHEYPPGGDYGHVLLYTDEITQKGEVPEYFPYHQLGGLRFQSLPGLPLLLSALSFMTGLESIPLAYYALLGSGLLIATVFVFTRLLGGDGPALLAAAIVALLPANLEMLSWSGYSNIFALAVIPVAAWALLKLRASRPAAEHQPAADSPPAEAGTLGWAALAGLMVVGVVLIHHLSAVIVLLALAAFALADVALTRWRSQAVAVYLFLASFGLALGLPILLHVLDNYFGADAVETTLGEATSVTTRITLQDAYRFFTPVVLLLACAGLVRLLVANRSGAAGRLVVLALAATIALVGYAWLFSVNVYYTRALYFAPIIIAPAAAYAVWHTDKTVVRPVLITLLVAYLTFTGTTFGVRSGDFYSKVTSDSYTALTWLRDNSQKDDVVLTDRCLAFHLEYLSQRPTVAAFSPELLSSLQEQVVARDASAMLLERRSQKTLFDEYSIDYVVFDTGCPEFNAGLVLRNLDAEPFLSHLFDFGPISVYKNLTDAPPEVSAHAAP
jgi:hypothetical protein